MKTLVCGDIHAKPHILDAVIQKFNFNNYDKLIFLGDYVDDWTTEPHISAEILNTLIEFKHNSSKPITLLLGNHDLSEWQGSQFACSGFNPNTHHLCKMIFQTYQYDFQIADYQDNWLFTHAGLTAQWIKHNKFTIIPDPDIPNAELWASFLNRLWDNRLDSPQHNTLMRTLMMVGEARGGFQPPSPIWTDKSELKAWSCANLNQIVGHSPVRTITPHTVKDGNGSTHQLIFCDTHSTYSNGDPIGDNTLLELSSTIRTIPLVK